MTLYVVGDDYCAKCKAENRAREQADAKRVDRFARYRVSKDLTPYGGAA